MFTKLFQKNTAAQRSPPPQSREQPSPLGTPSASSQSATKARENRSEGILSKEDIDPRVTVHYGIPSTASILAFDPIQSLLAVGTLDGRIKVIGGDNIEGLLVSPKPLPFKHLEFLQNRGFLVSVTNENEIQVWDLEQRQISATIKWESNITAFSVITGSSYMYVGDEYGMVSALKYDFDSVKLTLTPYYVPTDSIAEASGMSLPNQHSVVGVLPQPSSLGNRLLIAYQDGLIILWDVSEDKVIDVKGNKDLQLKGTIVADSYEDVGHKLSDDKSENEQEEKEISSLCWVSSTGSILAVGYVDGDILFWSLSTSSIYKDEEAETSDVIKLQLSLCDRKLPVIVLQWSASGSHSGQLFVYGGDAIGSEEVLTILSLDWSSGVEILRCVGRVDLTLNGSFADMVLLQSSGTREASGTFVLTSPGQLDFYDDTCLSSLISQQVKKHDMSSVQYPMVIPTIEPILTVGKLAYLCIDGRFPSILSEIISGVNFSTRHTSRNWPLTGGVPSQISSSENYQIERLYIAGYQDGSVKIWDATCPTFSLIYVVETEVKGFNIAGSSASVSALEFCSFTFSLAVGNELGMVRLYNLSMNKSERNLYLVKDTGKEVHSLHHGDGPHYTAVFSILSSFVCTLQYTNSGTRLAVGFKCGRVAMLDVSTSSVLFVTECAADLNSPIKFLALKSFSDSVGLLKSPAGIGSTDANTDIKEELLAVTMDADFVVLDANLGNKICSQSMQPEKNSIVTSAHILEVDNLILEASGEHEFDSSHSNNPKNEPSEVLTGCGTFQNEVHLEMSAETANTGQQVEDYVILCCVNALHLYSLKSLIGGVSKPIRSVDLLKATCWTTIFKMNAKEQGLIVLYQTGVIEIRSLPCLEVLGETSLMRILRWNFKNNMDKTICSSHNAQLILVNGCEYASVSLLACENEFRIPESWPCLHDKVLAAALNVTLGLSPNKQKGAAPRILGGLMKGFQAGREEHNMDVHEVFTHDFGHLDSIFSSPPFLKPSRAFANEEDVIELSIDDIDIDGRLVISSPSETSINDTKGKGTERDRLFEGATTDSTPRLRTAEEIKAKYRKEDASTAAARARDKLVQRQEKLERLSQRTEELQSGAENFASMANELVKQMEKRKWWNI